MSKIILSQQIIITFHLVNDSEQNNEKLTTIQAQFITSHLHLLFKFFVKFHTTKKIIDCTDTQDEKDYNNTRLQQNS